MESVASVIFDSHNEDFRSPQGAIPCGSAVTLRVLVSKALDAYGVTLRLWEDEEEQLLNMLHGRDYTETPYGAFFEEYTICVSRETPGPIWYEFVVNTPGKPLTVCNPADGLGGRADVLDRPVSARSFQLSFVQNTFSVPEWAKGAILYQIFPDRFFRAPGYGDSAGRKMHESWQEDPAWQIDPDKGYYPADDFFGGNLKGIEQKLDYLKSLHVDVLYLNPIFAAYSDHRYDTADYEQIDSLLGTQEDLESLCATAAARGIRVLLDGVFSHTGSDSKYFNREGRFDTLGAYQSPDSPYYEWYTFKQFPNEYDCWWGVWSLPCVKEMTPSYLAYMLKNEDAVVKKWLRAGVSGWRLDVADELPDAFLKELRQSVKEEKPDALILGEVWEDASKKISYGARREFLYGDELDSVMNYPLRNAIVSFLRQEISGDDFCRVVLSLRENYPEESFFCLMNFLSTHDLERITTRLAVSAETMTREEQAYLTLTDEQRQIALGLHKLAVLLVFALPGMPSIYYGDEAGVEGAKDPFNRKPYPWGRENNGLLEWYRTVAALRDDVMKRGSLYLDTAGSLLSVRRRLDVQWRYVLLNVSDETAETL
ncbi:MAG: glycoside hydrolase family 13 protein, partial [Clostridia bacterium]|nr:glycoside hydrolase family 13 protein [Clostridia bacterium]